MDHQEQAASLSALIADAKRLLALAEGRAAEGHRLLVVVSRAKSLDVCEWVEIGGRRLPDLPRTEIDGPITAIDRAIRELNLDRQRALGDVVDVSVHLDWELLRRVEQEDWTWVREIPDRPAIYRLRLVDADGRWVYVGETDDLQRRMGHYRTGDEKLPTNSEVHEFVTAHWGLELPVELDVAFRASVTTGGVSRELDLRDKLDRALAESAAIAAVPVPDLLTRRRVRRRPVIA